jgi:hypothetical protein
MKTPVVLVTATLTVAILLAASFLIATGTRGENAFRLRSDNPAGKTSSPGDPVFQGASDGAATLRCTGYWLAGMTANECHPAPSQSKSFDFKHRKAMPVRLAAH